MTRSRIAREHPCFLQDDPRDDNRRNADEVRAGRNPPGAAEQRARDERDNRELGAAEDKGRGHDGHPAVTVIFNGPARHDARNRTARPDKHRDKGFSGKPEFSEQSVHDERDTGHVAAGFQERQEEEEQDDHLGDKSENRADTGDNPIQDQEP